MTKLKKLMDEKFTKSSSIARMLGKTPATIFHWREGNSKMPAEAALIIASFYGVDVEDVIGDVVKQSRKRANLQVGA
jgi:DNA-binding transcriptional regulator YdaS (Cro superfamily)